jgi:outer membrane beta-barrel protein
VIRNLFLPLGFLGLLLLPWTARAQAKSGVQAYAVQEHPDQYKEEVTLTASYLLEDHFNNYSAFGLSYIHNVNPYFAWEVIQAATASALPTGLEKSLNQKYGADVPDKTDVIKYWISSNLVYTPLYMKNLFLGKTVVWSDLSLVGGYGIVRLLNTGSANMIDAGAMLRFFHNESWTYKLDLRQYFFFTSAVKPNFSVTLGLSYNFGSFVSQDKTQAQDKTP